MSIPGPIKPKHKPLQDYYRALADYSDQNVKHEGAVETAFQQLLAETARPHGGVRLVPKLPVKSGGKSIIPDGTLRDAYNLHRGYWEAKDTDDDLTAEIAKKIAKGYPLANTIFEDTRRAVLFQNGGEALQADLTDPQALADLLNLFYAHTEPDIEGFDQAVDEFKERVPELAQGLADKIRQAHTDNAKFQAAFQTFFALCQTALNPNISQAAVDEMLVQHLLTERLIRKIFDNPQFTQRNVIAAEVEKVIAALTSKSFNRDDFLKSLDRFYRAIEAAARVLEDFSEKQHFLNTVYERFFQGYSVKVADTHGIVYTPQEIVDFMCSSVAEVLEREFGKKLGDKDVQILDPCTGTGNFIVNLLRRISKRDLPRMYREQLFANEVMLLPYYIAALNIEHAYYDLTGEYEPFEGLCFVDTLDLSNGRQRDLSFMTEQNTARVQRQRDAPITVVLGNPPYNMGQQNENDANKNRNYEQIDQRIRATYAAASKATLKNKLYDPYVKFFRWATDRLGGRDGIVCLVSNNSFVDQVAFDGMRSHLLNDFTALYHLDLRGNVQKNPKLSGTTHNVFGIKVGVGITLAVRKRTSRKARKLRYCRVNEDWRRERKLQYLVNSASRSGVKWVQLKPGSDGTWLGARNVSEFRSLVAIGSKETKAGEAVSDAAIFKRYSLGVVTSRDVWAYGFSQHAVAATMQKHIENYSYELFRMSKRKTKPARIDDFVNNDPHFLKWTDRLKEALIQGEALEFDRSKIRRALYRPFVTMHLYFDHLLNQRRYQQHYVFPTGESERENRAIGLTTLGSEKPFMTLALQTISDLHLVGAGCGSQCFPYYVYAADGTNRRENITDWALAQFRQHYKTKKITKWDIFFYVYGLLHHAGYREKFADNLKRELPRIALAPDFRGFAKAGEELARLHLDYEKLDPWPLDWIEAPDIPLSYHVEKMKLTKDKTALVVNPSLTLAGIPPETFQYRLGNRSALDWFIDQYQVTQDKRSGIRSDPNRPDDPQYIVRLVGQVVHVSLETVRIVTALPNF